MQNIRRETLKSKDMGELTEIRALMRKRTSVAAVLWGNDRQPNGDGEYSLIVYHKVSSKDAVERGIPSRPFSDAGIEHLRQLQQAQGQRFNGRTLATV